MRKIKEFAPKYCLFILSVIMLLNNKIATAQNDKGLHLIPEPNSVIFKNGSFTFGQGTNLAYKQSDAECTNVANYFNEQVKTLIGYSLPLVNTDKSGKNSILLQINYKSEIKESYTIKIDKNNVVINGASAQGLFYGVQTLLQLLYPEVQETIGIKLPCLEIMDKPSFSWRGMHLDVCRHFFSVDFIKKMIDMMAFHKMNVFHWHLTDDQGWRIEIKKYPKLNEISAYRDETLIGQYTENDQKFDGIRYGGYYTQDQIREVIRYAQSRYITIVPEIEMPGHAVAVLSAYPEYSCTGGPFKVFTKWGVSDDVFCPGKEKTFEFLQDVLTEVIDLFPGSYIHIGGDECPKTRWKACPDCQKRIKDVGLKDELELQSYFVKRMEKFIASKGKKLIGWDEILEGGLPERATVMSWRGYEGGTIAASSGHDVVMTPSEYCYLNFYQSENGEKEPLSFNAYLPLDKVYSFNPMLPTISGEQQKHILGAQVNVWSEYITSDKQAEYMIFPRLCAMSDILWIPKEKKNYSDFLDRLRIHLKRLQKLNTNYRPLDN